MYFDLFTDEWASFCLQAPFHTEEASQVKVNPPSAVNGIVHPKVLSAANGPSPVPEVGSCTHGEPSGTEDELEFPHDLLPSTDLSGELDLTWNSSLR